MKTKLLISSIFLLTAGAVAGYPYVLRARSRHFPTQAGPANAPNPPTAVPAAAAAISTGRPRIDAVFVLDTTGSMSGLIAAAKENIWSIATTMASAQPAPEIRIGLVAFRDRGDAYVTNVIDLSSDLDSMYAKLMDFRAEGGGDIPESVNQALYDAVHKMSWTQSDEAYKVIFLVGDAPPHMDYADDVKYPDTLSAAGSKKIVVNTIQAGQNSSTRTSWQHIAQLNQGQYFEVPQNGNAVAVATPFDEPIAKLSRSLDETRLFYGDAEHQRVAQYKAAATDKLHSAGSLPARARRAAFNASSSGKENLLGDHDLVEAVESGRVDLAKVEPSELPAPLRSLGKDEQADAVKKASAKRAEISREIKELTEKRKGYIDAELKNRDGGKDSLDYKIFTAIKAQAEPKGLTYGDAPHH